MAGVLKNGSQQRMKNGGLERHPVEARQRTIIGTIGEKAAVALGREVQWL